MDLPVGCKISEARVHYTSHFGLRRVRAETLQPAAVSHAVTSGHFIGKDILIFNQRPMGGCR
jgi:hypothetical protein